MGTVFSTQMFVFTSNNNNCVRFGVTSRDKVIVQAICEIFRYLHTVIEDTESVMCDVIKISPERKDERRSG